MKRIGTLLGSVITLFVISAGTAEAANPVITIQQVSAHKIGSWVLLHPAGNLKSGDVGVDAKNYTARPKAGGISLVVTTPVGATSQISVYENGELTQQSASRQVSIDAVDDNTYRFVVKYIFNQNASFGLTSTPSGLIYTMKGPDGRTYRGRTPRSYRSVPTGVYNITIRPTNGCAAPRPYNYTVESDQRNVFHIEFDCTSRRQQTIERSSRPIPSRRSLINSVDAREAARRARLYNRTTPRDVR